MRALAWLGPEKAGEALRKLRSKLQLEFGARSTGEPGESRLIQCDAAAYLADARAPGGERLACHWHGVARLDTAGFVVAAWPTPCRSSDRLR